MDSLESEPVCVEFLGFREPVLLFPVAEALSIYIHPLIYRFSWSFLRVLISWRLRTNESHCILHPKERICKHLTEQLASRIRIFETHVICNLVWQLPLSTALLWSAPSVDSNIGHFIGTTIALNFPSETKVGDYRLESAVLDELFFIPV